MSLAAPQDVADALEHLEVWFGLPEGFVEPDMFEFHDEPAFDYTSTDDDLGSWPEWSEDELKDLDGDELRAELESFRGEGFGDRAMGWIETGEWPPIVVIESPEFHQISDGRGRTSVAIGMGIEELPATILTVTSPKLTRAMRKAMEED